MDSEKCIHRHTRSSLYARCGRLRACTLCVGSIQPHTCKPSQHRPTTKCCLSKCAFYTFYLYSYIIRPTPHSICAGCNARLWGGQPFHPFHIPSQAFHHSFRQKNEKQKMRNSHRRTCVKMHSRCLKMGMQCISIPLYVYGSLIELSMCETIFKLWKCKRVLFLFINAWSILYQNLTRINSTGCDHQ